MMTFPRRKFGYDAIDGQLEGRLRLFREEDFLTVGADWTSDIEKLIQVYNVDPQMGTVTLTSAPAGHKTLRNAGVYGQAIVHPWRPLGLVANLRYDNQNVYGGSINYRLGVIWTPLDLLTTKLLYGTSYRAPAALQLYGQPLVPGDALGNPNLKPERARLLEGAVILRPLASLAVTGVGFLSRVSDRIEVRPVVANLQPVNSARQHGWGIESEARYSVFRNVLAGTYSFQHTNTITPDPFFGDQSQPTERYPRVIAQLRWQYRHELWGTPGVMVRYVSERRASASNIRENLQIPYELRPYTQVDLAYQKTLGPHALQLRLDNLFLANSVEPGFGGVDIPRRQRLLWVSYSFGL